MSIDIRDLLIRAFHTFWQSFVAVLGVTWAASGIDVSQITDIDSAKKIVVAALAAVGAAALSALKTTVKAFSLGKSGIFETDDPDPNDIPATPEVVAADAEPHMVARTAGVETVPLPEQAPVAAPRTPSVPPAAG